MKRARTGATQPATATPPPAAPAREARMTVVFVRPHEHRGVAYITGDTYQATAAERDTLRRFGAIEAS